MSDQDARELRRGRIKRMLSPKSAVFIGGAAMIPAIEYCRARGFQGEIFVVNPRRNELAGVKCVPTISELPIDPDVAFLAVPRDGLIGVVRELASIGAGGAICNTSGFSEMHGGEESQRQLVEAAGEMPIIGPNCPGVANFADRACFMMDHFGDQDVGGCVALISNGGSYLSDLGCADRSIPIAYSIGLGNQAMLSVADLMDVVLDDPRVKAINLYLESIREVSVLSAAALKAARKNIPVVVIKGGRTTAGQRATQSHTASLAGDDVVASALFRRLGFVEVGTPLEALETLKMLVYAPSVKGRRTAYVTSSGTYAVLGSDVSEFNGLDLQPPSAEAAAETEKYLPPFIHPANPLDISSAQNEGYDHNLDLYRAYLSDQPDMALMVMCFPPEKGWDPITWQTTTAAFAKAAAEREIPAAFVNTVPELLPKADREKMIADGLVPLQSLEDGIRAVSNAMRASELAEELARKSDDEILIEPRLTGQVEPMSLDEAEAKAELAIHGVSVPRNIVVQPETRVSLEELQFPVVVKALSSELAHKSELGGVALKIQSAEEVWQIVRLMAAKLKQTAPHIDIQHFLVEEMVRDGVGELLVGIRHVDGIGLALTVGFGGTEAELLRDTKTVLLPASSDTISEAIQSLRLYPLLSGWRGRIAGDVEAAVSAIKKMSDWAISLGEAFVEAEINPLIVRPKGVVAVDAVTRLSKKAAPTQREQLLA
ncbi:acyl-CoA synthetase (NDP forming) [Mesorhizobium robiniae]|uniref:Acyl-CoA synthetase (NDP forming) n=1 Tax=Mesorhizobium robiniae TaxID=559315 RepID=A0ABV2GYR0_9HYPH|nr:acetate--CoA ligase family protein [Mesorhizobium sp. ZC-5]MCV3243941.1 acetate--CoA ligase family protein [Mesorhizobium sp. ZC-5]